MTCREAVYSEDVLEYIIDNYRGEDFVLTLYNPVCYMAYDEIQGVVYQQNDAVDAQVVEKYGYSQIPNLYGLMSEEALEASGVLQIRRQPYFDLYGQGVLIGFVDTGIDYTHEAFQNADGTTRIAELWDQTAVEGDGTGHFPYGRVYDREAINEALLSDAPYEIVPSTDTNGHGTFLAGVAAGGEDRRAGFSGVAPLAELVIVKCKQAKRIYRNYYSVPDTADAFQENDVMAGISYILQIARREKKPVVICLGIGTNMGSHNGGSNLTAFMERYMAVQGVFMVNCAGNEGNARHHYSIRTRDDSAGIRVDRDMDGFMLQLWWVAPGSLELSVTSPGGEQVQGIQARSRERYVHTFSPDGSRLEIFFGIAQEFTREQVVVFRFRNVRAGIWKIGVKSDYDDPKFNMWLPIRQFLSSPVEFLQPEPDITVCNPGTGSYSLTVSAYDVIRNSLYFEAGRGFTPNGAVKPEVVAPGVDITGPLPRNRYGEMTGTGVAAAFAAGIGALFLQQYQGTVASGITIRGIFIQGVEKRGEPYPNTEWGFGIVNAYNGLVDSLY